MSAFPATRLRRLRSSGALRSLVRETRLDLDDFVMPLFVGPTTQANEALPALGRFTVDDLGAEVEELARLGVGAVILFGIPDEKDERGLGRLGRRTASSSARCGRCGPRSPSCCCSPTSASASTPRTATAA